MARQLLDRGRIGEVVADQAERVDGNTVDLDREMSDLTKNGLLYQAAAQIVASRLASLRSAVSGR